MNPAIPSIDQLKEMALPAPVSYAPQTWGWWALLALLIVTLLVMGARRYWQWRRDRYRREALVRLEELQQRSNDLSALRELPELLKRVALSMPSTSPVGAGLLAKRALNLISMSTDRTPSRASRIVAPPLPQGSPAALGKEDWQVFLQRHIEHPLPSDFSQQLSLLAYAPDATLQAMPTEQRQQLFSTCKTWVERHHVAA
ncbi:MULTISPECIES: DUF4381 domain-containing protein [unclassified Pseudomonas]|uniref:DUF4381 domain-containing protein n=1 Tax=unclassified Pseudomonas TaxID=196821 RepID=UPI001CBC2E3C|nr:MULTISPECIES: DUF4381 domain-containing protein [unclassified Pseudomonas]MBI3908145.1 DUF4381 domain-containing protein [Pseudomonas fluorescens]